MCRHEHVRISADPQSRRGFSLDFRSLGFGLSSASSTPTETAPDPALKPLTLASRASVPVSASSAPKAVERTPTDPASNEVDEAVYTSSITQPRARRLDKEDEDDNDKKERHRLEASLKLMGLNSSSSSSSNPAAPNKTVRPSRKLTKTRAPTQEERRPLVPTPVYPADMKRGTPLTRLSSALSSTSPSSAHTSPLSPAFSNDDLTLPAEVVAENAFREFDQREKEVVRAVSRGSGGGYTSPVSRSSHSGRRSLSYRASGEGQANGDRGSATPPSL